MNFGEVMIPGVKSTAPINSGTAVPVQFLAHRPPAGPEAPDIPSTGNSSVMSVLHPNGNHYTAQVHAHGPRMAYVSTVVPYDTGKLLLRPANAEALSLAVEPAIMHAVSQPWAFTVTGANGEVWSATLGLLEHLRAGPSEYVYEYSGKVNLVKGPENNPYSPEMDLNTIPHAGVVTLMLRYFPGTGFLSAQLLWQHSDMSDPIPWFPFCKVEVSAPWGVRLRRSMDGSVSTDLPTTDTGDRTVTTLVDQNSAFLPHEMKVWDLLAWSTPQSQNVASMFGRGEWWSIIKDEHYPETEDSEGVTIESTLKVFDTPGVLLGERSMVGVVIDDVDLMSELMDMQSNTFSPGNSLSPVYWRNPHGDKYGATGGGSGIAPFYGQAHYWGSRSLLYRWARRGILTRTDRMRTSLADPNGHPFAPDGMAFEFQPNFVISPAKMYGTTTCLSWPSNNRDPFRADQAYPEAQESFLPHLPFASKIKEYGSDDPQHWVRGHKYEWAMVEYFADPMALRLVEISANAIRWDWMEKEYAPGASPNNAALYFRSTGEVDNLGRDFAWLGCHMALAAHYGATQSEGTIDWLEAWTRAVCNHPHQAYWYHVVRQGKEMGYALAANPEAENLEAVGQTYQQAFVLEAIRWVHDAIGDDTETDAAEFLMTARRGQEAIHELAWGESNDGPDYRIAVAGTGGDPDQGSLENRAAVEALYSSSVHLGAGIPGADGSNVLNGTYLPLFCGLGEDEGRSRLLAYLGLTEETSQEHFVEALRGWAESSPAIWYDLFARAKMGQ